MASKTFEIRTEPHVATVGKVELFFEPEVVGAEFAAAYDKLRAVQTRVAASQGNKSSSTKHAKAADPDGSILTEAGTAVREFVRGFLVPDSRTVFDQMRIPDRVLHQLLEWTTELYGGGSGNPDAAGGTSSG